MAGSTYWQVMVGFIMLKLKVLMRNPLGSMVYMLFGKWYFMVTMAAIIVVYGVFYNLENVGFFDWFLVTLSDSLDVVKSVAWNCTSQIAEPMEMWECMKNPPDWSLPAQLEGERELIEGASDELNPNRIFEDNINEDLINPYEEK